MGSHYENIGFVVTDFAGMAEVGDQVLAHGVKISGPQIDYYCLDAGGGAELWLAIGAGMVFEGMTPAYRGESRIPVHITAYLPEEEYFGEGKLHCWVNPSDDAATGEYPMLCDVVEYAGIRARLHVPARATLQLSAFAHSVRCYPDDAQYYQFQEDNDGAPLAVETFMPIGLFLKTDEDGTVQKPRPMAIITGHVLSASRVINTITQQPFYALTVQTAGAVIDVVGDLEHFPIAPEPGWVVQGEYWLSGRIIDNG